MHPHDTSRSACIGVKLIGMRAPMEFMAAFLGGSCWARHRVQMLQISARDCEASSDLHLTFIFCFSTCFIIFHHISAKDALLFDLAKPTVQPLLVRVTLHHSTRPVGSWIISHEFSSLVHNGTCHKCSLQRTNSYRRA